VCVNHAFRGQKGAIVDLGSLPGVHANNSGASWISPNGIIAGASETDLLDPLLGGPELRAVLWTKHGQIINLGTVGGNESVALAVNSQGQVAGWSTNTIADPFSILQLGFEIRAFLWQHGVMRDLGTLGGPDALASYVNERGQVAGISYTNSTPNLDVQCPGAVASDLPATHPFLWENGTMLDLGTLGGNCGGPTAFNNQGQVTGISTVAGDLISHPFLWHHGVITDLGTLGGG
jgi:probable HAF family extracellular repeat protein